MPDDKGQTRYDHYSAIARQGGNVKELHLPELPKCVQYIWDLFLEMNADRPNYGMGALPLTRSFMLQYHKNLMNIEIQIIRAIDREYMEQAHHG